MSNSLLSFVGGMGAGAMSQYERNKDRARQDRQDDRLDRQEQRQMTLDAQSKELHDERMEEVKRNKANRQSDIEAAKPVVAQNAWEQSVQGMTPEQQQDLAEKMSYGEVEGTKTYEVQGKSYGADKAASDVALAQANTPEAKQARLVQNMRNTARFSEADQLETAHRQGKAADMTLRTGERAEKAAKLQEANTVWNTAVMDSVKKHGNVHAGLAAIMSESEIGPVSGVKFSSVPSKDGKTVQYIATDASGKQSVFKTYATGEAGAMEALQDSMRVSPETQLQFMAERQARAAAAEKAKMDAAEHAAKIKLMGAQGLYYSGRGAAAKAGAAGAGAVAGFDPLQGFDPKEAQSAATKVVDEAIAGSGKPLTPQQRADAIAKQTFALRDAYASSNSQRERARVFSSAARSASTPAQIAEVRARAMQSGYTDAEMAAIDPRFAAPASPAR